MFGLGKRIEDAGLMEEDDRITYIGRQVWIVLQQVKDGSVDVVSAHMDDDVALATVAQIKDAGGYAWCRDAVIDA